MSRRFNASVSTLGIPDDKVRQAIMKLLENSLYNREISDSNKQELKESIRRISQKLSSIDFDIDASTAQQIAALIDTDLAEAVRRSEAGASTATTKASEAAASATSAASDAADVAEALADMESTIEEHAQTAAQTAIAQVTQNVSTAVSQAQTAAQTAATAATNANTKATEATNAANNAAAAVQGIKNVNLCSTTVYNATYDQYRKIATLPVSDYSANAVITIYGSIGGWINSEQKPIYLCIGNREDDGTDAIDVNAYVFGSSPLSLADIVIYKESNNTFSVYLKGARATYFKHNVAMMYSELVTAVTADYTISTPTGTLVWSLLSNYKVVSTTDHTHSQYALATHNHAGVYQPVGNYQPAGNYAAADHNHSGVYQPAGSYAAATIEKIAWSHIYVDLQNRSFLMSGLVSDTTATYNLKVTFINRNASYARSCLVNGTTVSLAKGVGQTASHQTTVSGSGSFTIDNIANSVDVFVRIWR